MKFNTYTKNIYIDIMYNKKYEINQYYFCYNFGGMLVT